MADLPLFVSTPKAGYATLGTGADQTMLSIQAPANQAIVVTGLKFGFDGISNAGKPIPWRVEKKTASSGTGTAITPAAQNGQAETPQGTYKGNFTVEPTVTANTILAEGTAHPQLGDGVFLPFDKPIRL